MGTDSSGKREHQKLKSYIVLQILQKETDENHVMSAMEIAAALEEMGIDAERRSIYKDIREINRVMYMLENRCTIDEAVKVFPDKPGPDYDPEEAEFEKFIVYDEKRKGFYVRQRRYDYQQIRLLAESVYTSKFLTQNEVDGLADVLCDFVSEHQAKAIRHNALSTDRVKTSNHKVIDNISVIDDAMSTKLNGEKHIPEKISFKYLQRTLGSTQQVERRKGDRYIVSPYKLLICDGNYYLLAFEDNKQKLLTFRVDRMKDIRRMGVPRDGEEAFKAVKLDDYTKRTFSMFAGKTERVKMRFINRLLDAVVERFGTSGVIYEKVDENHFAVTASVDVSDQFFGWLLGFGRMVKLIEPQPVVERFSAYLDKVREMY